MPAAPIPLLSQFIDEVFYGLVVAARRLATKLAAAMADVAA
jgi:hypothetical protein